MSEKVENVENDVMGNMFGIFNQAPENIVTEAVVEESNRSMLKIDPKKADDGTYRAVIRLVPNVFDPVNHVVRQTTYWLPGTTGKGFSYLSPKTKGKYESCAVADRYWEWMGSKDARLIKLAKSKIQYNRKAFVVVQVLMDMVNAKNNGKFFLLNLPIKLQKMIDAKLHPSEDDIKLGESPVNVFDPMSAPTMTLKVAMKKVTKDNVTNEYRDWDACIWNDKLAPIVDPETAKKFKDEEGNDLEGEALQKAIVGTLMEVANLKSYKYEDPSEAVLTKVKNALDALEGMPVNAEAEESATDNSTDETESTDETDSTDEVQTESSKEEVKTEPATEAKKEEEPAAETKKEEAPAEVKKDDDILKGFSLD